MSSLELYFRFFSLKIALFFKKDSFIINGIKFAFVQKSAKYLFREIFFKKTYYFETTKKDPLIFDCGANVGFATIYFKMLYPESKVIAFEANAKTHDLLQSNLVSYSSVTTHQKALVDFEGEVKFFYNKNELADLGMSINQRYFKDFEMVPATQLSNYIDQTVDLLKLDIEGAEALVVKDLISSGKIKQIKQMIIEYHHTETQSVSHIGRFIHDLEINNFTCHVSTEREEVFTSPRVQTFIIYAFNTSIN